jgi:hypothetical protein
MEIGGGCMAFGGVMEGAKGASVGGPPLPLLEKLVLGAAMAVLLRESNSTRFRPSRIRMSMARALET